MSGTDEAARLLVHAASLLLSHPAPTYEQKGQALVLCARAMRLVAESDPHQIALEAAKRRIAAEAQR